MPFGETKQAIINFYLNALYNEYFLGSELGAEGQCGFIEKQLYA
jgi:hypothetical protein